MTDWTPERLEFIAADCPPQAAKQIRQAAAAWRDDKALADLWGTNYVEVRTERDRAVRERDSKHGLIIELQARIDNLVRERDEAERLLRLVCRRIGDDDLDINPTLAELRKMQSPELGDIALSIEAAWVSRRRAETRAIRERDEARERLAIANRNYEAADARIEELEAQLERSSRHNLRGQPGEEAPPNTHPPDPSSQTGGHPPQPPPDHPCRAGEAAAPGR